jgi:hypothetical protein
MTRIAITEAAYRAIAATLRFGTVAVEPELNARGEREIWLDPTVLDTLTAMRQPGESYSDAILRLTASQPPTTS